MLSLELLERRRNTIEYREEIQRINRDEWLQASRSRSWRLALQAVIFAQVPLMFFMAYVPPKPSVVGMGIVTAALGCGVFAAAYLFHIRESHG